MVFNFHHLKVDYPNGDKWTKAPFDFLELKRIFNHWQSGMHGRGGRLCSGATTISRASSPASVTRVSIGSWPPRCWPALHGLQGTPYIYQGEEIGMTNPGYQRIDDYQDVESRNIAIKQAGDERSRILAILGAKSRDNSRTPMQWAPPPTPVSPAERPGSRPPPTTR